MKKIAIFGVNAQYKVGGTEVCINQIYNHFKNEYDIEIISGSRCVYEKFEKYDYKKLTLIKLVNIKYFSYLNNFINYFIIYNFFKKNDYDIVFSNGSTSIAATNAIVSKKGKSIYFIHDEFSLNKRPEYGALKSLKKKYFRLGRKVIDYPFFIFHCFQNSKALKNSDAVIANSSYIASLLVKQEDINPFVIYPFTRTKDKKIKTQVYKKYITMVGSGEVKGIKTFLEIASLMPNEQFRVIGRGLEVKQIENVLFHPFFDDVSEMYANTKLLLVPSIWQEAFGKVSLEAASYKIPVLVSNRGGLPETVCDENLVVLDYLNPLAWQKKIELIMANPSSWGDLCQKHALKFDLEKDAKKLKALLVSLIKN